MLTPNLKNNLLGEEAAILLLFLHSPEQPRSPGAPKGRRGIGRGFQGHRRMDAPYRPSAP